MANDDNAARTLSADEKQLVDYAALIAAVVQRQVTPPPAQDPKKAWWSAFLEPAVLAALITVLIGGIAATLITGIIQWRAGAREFQQSQLARDREFEQAWLKSRGDQALVSYKEYLDQEQALIRRAYSLIGTCTSSSDRLVGLTGGIWRQQFVGANRLAVDNQAREIRESYNQSFIKWKNEGEELGLLMGYYHPSQPNVGVSWRKVRGAVTDYLECAEKWYKAHPPTQKPPTDEELATACKVNYDDLLVQLNDLTASLESARRYAWTGWDSPQEIKALLDKKSR